MIRKMNVTRIVLLFVVVAIIAAFLVVFEATRTEYIAVSDILPGRIRHNKLALELVDRVKANQPILADVYPQTLEQWVEGFH